MNALSGQTLRWIWTSGPTANQTHEHEFHRDGTMTWRILDGPAKGKSGEEKEYAAVEVANSVYLVSYLSQHSGFTVTVVLNLKDDSIVGFASNEKEWHQIEGRLEMV
jgi:phenolic acid decarboxylase